MTETVKHEVGVAIEARCAKCKAITNHIVLDLKKDGEVKKVRCEPCSYEHAYRQPRIQNGPAKIPVVKQTAAERKQVKAYTEFDAMMEGYSSKEGIPYAMTTSFNVDDIMDHSIFGRGRVEEVITPDKAVVNFREGSKVLVCVIKTEFED